LLIALALFKIQKFLHDGLRLRTACDLEIKEGSKLEIQRPREFAMPSLTELEAELPKLIRAVSEEKDAEGKSRHFANPSSTILKYEE
jgi:CRISPR-associated protein Csb1